MNVNKAAVELIKKYESLHDGDLKVTGLQPKMCPAGIWSVGYGHALRDGNGQFLRGEACEEEAYRQYARLEESGALALLEQDLEIFSGYVLTLVVRPVTDNQFGAMVSLCYNIGMTAFKNSSVLRLYNMTEYHSAAYAFQMWDKGTVNGKKIILPGLVKRRLAERTLFLTP